MTPGESKVLIFLTQFWAVHFGAPSFAEITEGCGYKSKSQAYRVIQSLESKGFVKRMGGARMRRNLMPVSIDGCCPFCRRSAA